MSNFVRPKDLKFPQVYHTFKAKDKNSEEIVEYRVQDLPEEYFEESIELFIAQFIPDEPFCIASDVQKKPELFPVYAELYRKILRQKLTIACFKNGSDDLVAVNNLTVSSQSDEEENFEHLELKMVHEAYYHCCKTLDVFTMYNIEHYLSGYGLCVNREYRGRNIATEMLRARVPFLKTLGLQVTCTMFSGIGAQVAAMKAGYEEVFSISCEELQKLFPYFDFTKTPDTKFIKILAIKVTE